MDKTPVISVIVPVYKVEEYLPRCIDSILSQEFTDFELLLIDDGSPDGSGKICDEYAAKDNRIRVFHKENGGVSSARNLGLDNACGEWIMFVDADDWLAGNTITECIKISNDYDIVRFGHNSIFDKSGNVVKNWLPDAVALNEYLKLIIERKTTIAVWGGIYRRSIFQKNKIYFDTTLSMGEDWVVLINAIMHSNNIGFISLPLYQYNRYNEDGCVNNFTFGKQIEMAKALNIIRDIVKSNNIVDEYKESLSISQLKILSDMIHLNLTSSVPANDFFKRRKDFANISPSPSMPTIISSKIPVKDKLVLLLCMNGRLGYKLMFFVKSTIKKNNIN